MSLIEPVDTTDESGIRDARRRAVLDARQADLDLYEVMKSELARRVLWDLIGVHGAYQSSFSSNPVEMAFNEGQRNFAVRVIERLLRVCPELYLQAQTEAINRKGKQ